MRHAVGLGRWRVLAMAAIVTQHRGRWHDLDLYTITPKTTEAPSGP